MNSAARRCLAIVLAAGEGIRMRSSRPKALHTVAGRSMLAHVLGAVREAGADEVAVVVGPDRDDVAAGGADSRARRRRLRSDASAAAQPMRCSLRARRSHADTTTYSSPTPTFRCFAAQRWPRCARRLAEGAGLVALGFAAADPTGYGRLIERDGGRLVAIREDKDASAAERAARLCNAGPVAFVGARSARACWTRCGPTTRRANFT